MVAAVVSPMAKKLAFPGWLYLKKESTPLGLKNMMASNSS